jgi:hypothetical protein
LCRRVLPTERVQAAALRSVDGVRVFLANVTADSHPVRVEGLAGWAKRAALGEASGSDVGFEIELVLHEVARFDAVFADAGPAAVRQS